MRTDLKRFAASTVLTVLGILLVIFGFFERFVTPYTTSSLVGYVLFIAVLCNAFTAFIKKGGWGYVVLLLCGLLFFYINREAVIGGFCNYIDRITDYCAYYYDTPMYFINIGGDPGREADMEMAVYMLAGLLAMLYAFIISRNKAVWVPIVLTMIFVAAPFVVENGTTMPVMVAAIVFCMALFMQGTTYNEKNISDVQLFAIILGTFIIICGVIFSNISKEEDYVKSDFYQNVVDGVIDVGNRIGEAFGIVDDSGASGGLSGFASSSTYNYGAVGDVDSVSYDNETVMTLHLQYPIESKLYLMGFAGSKYTNNIWTKDGKALFKNDDFSTVYSFFKNAGAYMDFEKEWQYSILTVDIEENYSNNIYRPSYSYGTDGSYAFYIFDQTDLCHLKKGYYEQEYETNAYTMEYTTCNTILEDEFKERFGGQENYSAADRYAIALQVRQYLADNCNYSKTPGAVPEGRELVEYFLTESHEGYCTYFATAAVMMLRAAGIPARYVEGFVVDTHGKTEVEVKDSMAHAWVQYYVDEVGWVDFEVTPGNYSSEEAVENETTTHEEQETTTREERETTKPVETTTANPSETTVPIHGTETSTPEGAKTASSGFKMTKHKERIILVTFIVLVALCTGTLFFVVRYKRYRLMLEKISDDKSDVSVDDCIKLLYNNYLVILKKYGLVREKHITEMAFFDRAKTLPYISEEEAYRMAFIYEKSLFGKAERTDLDAMFVIYQRISDRLYGHRGIIVRAIFKYFYLI